jgi:hypothetical protein
VRNRSPQSSASAVLGFCLWLVAALWACPAALGSPRLGLTRAKKCGRPGKPLLERGRSRTGRRACCGLFCPRRELKVRQDARVIFVFADMSLMGPGCTKTRAFNLRAESSSQFGQSENQKCWRRLSEEGNREKRFYGYVARVRFHAAWVKGGCCRQADAAAGLPPAPEMPMCPRQFTLGAKSGSYGRHEASMRSIVSSPTNPPAAMKCDLPHTWKPFARI